jgi:hypothetical protein
MQFALAEAVEVEPTVMVVAVEHMYLVGPHQHQYVL